MTNHLSPLAHIQDRHGGTTSNLISLRLLASGLFFLRLLVRQFWDGQLRTGETASRAHGTHSDDMTLVILLAWQRLLYVASNKKLAVFAASRVIRLDTHLAHFIHSLEVKQITGGRDITGNKIFWFLACYFEEHLRLGHQCGSRVVVLKPIASSG